MASYSQAAFVVVETFDGLSAGAINSQNGWVSNAAGFVVTTDPADAGNQVLSMNNGSINSYAYKALPSSITDSSTATTLFFVPAA